MSEERDGLVNALREAARGSRRSKIARLREIFDEVEAAKAAGTSNKNIVAVLEAQGLVFDVNNFKNARSRILRERKMEALAQAAQSISSPSPSSSAPSSASSTKVRKDPQKNPKATTPSKEKNAAQAVAAEPEAPAAKGRTSTLTTRQMKQIMNRDIDLSEYE